MRHPTHDGTRVEAVSTFRAEDRRWHWHLQLTLCVTDFDPEDDHLIHRRLHASVVEFESQVIEALGASRWEAVSGLSKLFVDAVKQFIRL